MQLLFDNTIHFDFNLTICSLQNCFVFVLFLSKLFSECILPFCIFIPFVLFNLTSRCFFLHHIKLLIIFANKSYLLICNILIFTSPIFFSFVYRISFFYFQFIMITKFLENILLCFNFVNYSYYNVLNKSINPKMTFI